MPDYEEFQASSAKVDLTVSKAAIVSDVTEETDTDAEAKGINASPEEIDGKAPSGSSGDDNVEYVHGHPVIRNGTLLLLVNTATIRPALTRPGRHGRVQVRRVGS